MSKRLSFVSSKGLLDVKHLRRWQTNPSINSRRNASRCQIDPNNPFVKVSEEVREAISQQKPVVALESTIYTHGFPYPDNIALASHLESVVRVNGGIPATIGVLDGVARVGVSAEELIKLTTSAGKLDTRKVSRRDLAYLLGLGYAGRKLNGGTTVSGTMLLAKLANIEVFATGGLGGVHRGGEDSMDISADLTELGRTKLAVVSSGCKSFLDIPRTLEYLETQGVCVGTFSDSRKGQVDFPAFWTRESGIKSPLTITDEKEAAAMIYAQRSIPVESGLLFANPISHEQSIAKEKMEAIIAQALRDAEVSRSSGSDNTPFVLRRIREITNGESVTANRALIEANVTRGTRVAVRLAEMSLAGEELWSTSAGRDSKQSSSRVDVVPPTSSANKDVPSTPGMGLHSMENAADVIVAGALAIDLSCDFIPPGDEIKSAQPLLHTSNPASIRQSLGGVGHNVATTLEYLNCKVRLCSCVGDDIAGSTALNLLTKRGLQTSGIGRLSSGSHTAQYVAVNDARKGLVLGMADMNILQHTNSVFNDTWRPHIDVCRPKWLVLDANWDSSTIHEWLRAAKASGVRIAYEPVSAAKSRRIFPPKLEAHTSLAAFPGHLIDLATPNALELASIHQAAHSAGAFDRDDWWSIIDSIGLSNSGSRDKFVALTTKLLVEQGVPQQSIRLLPFIPCILTTLGEQGVLLTQLLRPGDDRLTSPESAPYILCRSAEGNAVVGGVYMRLFPPVETVPKDEIVSVNGVGDTFLGVIIAGRIQEYPKDIVDLVDIAQSGSVLTLKSSEPVSPQIAQLRKAL